jgi:hypothetical protein
VSSHSLTDVPEQNHDAMRAAAERPVSGNAATEKLAAGGGLELPGREQPASPLPIVGIDRNDAHEPIPGEYDATTLTHREAGAMGGAFNGTDNLPNDPDAVSDARTRREWTLEGGGRDGARLVEHDRTAKDKREKR